MQDWYERVAELAREALRDGGTNNSFSHDEAHARRTAELTQQIADLYGFCQQEKKFVYAAAYFHDLKRSPTEDPTVGDEKASAKKARMLLEKAGSVTVKEVEAIAYAIENHGHYPECLRDIVTRERIPEALEEKLHLVLFVADKIEQNGVRGIARGFQFMAGDHLRAEGGGWRSFGFKPDRDEALVIAIEGLLRLAFINPEGIYPSRLKPVVAPLYQTLREAVLGGLSMLGLRVEDIARLLLESKTRDGRNILEVRQISAPQNINDLAELISVRSGICNQDIAAASALLAFSVSEAVEYFSRNYNKDLGELISLWRPLGQKAQEWQRAMKEEMAG